MLFKLLSLQTDRQTNGPDGWADGKSSAQRHSYETPNKGPHTLISALELTGAWRRPERLNFNLTHGGRGQ